MTRSWPVYLDTWKSGQLASRIDEGYRTLESCTVCPRDCAINRMADERKVCKVGRKAVVSSAFAHFGEEDCLRGWNGSGTIFFGWCNLKCVFCQNWEVSQEGAGNEMDAQQIAELMLDLQGQGCHNINFVTPEHVVPQILEALPYAFEAGLRVPLIYNTSAYDSLHSLELMDGLIDIYMPDFKYWDESRSARLLKAKDYPEVARSAVREMHRQVGQLTTDNDGLAMRGLIIRHLVMPDGLSDTEHILRWVADELGTDTYVNIMDQYHPDGRVVREPQTFKELALPLAPADHLAALDLARAAGLSRIDERNPHPRLGRRLGLRLL